MRGQLFLESEPDQGTTATFVLQLALTEKVPGSKEEITMEDPNEGGLHILVVEDDEISSRLVQISINSLGMTSALAIDASEALSMLKSTHFDLVLMDCGLPGMDGFEAARAIRRGEAGKANQNIPIIAQTAFAMKGDEEKCLNSGMNQYISKPLDYKRLGELIKGWSKR